MDFTFVSQAPIVIFLHDGKDRVEIPRFKRKDWKAWAATEDAKRTETATKDLDAEARAKFLAFYTITPSSPREMQRNLMTYDGQDYIIRTSLKKVGWDDEQIDKFLEDNTQNSIEELAFALASVQPNIPQKPAESTADQEKEGISSKNQVATTSQRG